MKKILRNLLYLCGIALMMLLSSHTYAQKSISGKIVDAKSGDPLPGVTIVVKGTTTGTVSDYDGNYSLLVPKGSDQLVYSMIGYEKQTIRLSTSSVINVSMKTATTALGEVVVVGYGEQSRAQMTTSVSKMDTKNLESIPLSNAGSALQGTVAGLSVQNTTGQPGSTPNIVMRGGTSWNGSGSPLVIVDGVISSFYALNPDDIASVEVLKDAAATAIYGARAANGVILVTTKKGKVGKSEISYTVKYGVNRRRESYKYLNAHDYIYYNRLAVQNYTMVTGRTNFDAGFLNGRSGGFGTGNNTTDSPFTTMYLSDQNKYLLNYAGWKTMTDPLDPNKQLIYQENNMSDLYYQNSYVQDHYLSFDGGNNKGTYSLGLGYLDDAGIVLGSGFTRYSGKLNASYNVMKNVKVSTNILYSSSSQKGTYLPNYSWVFQRAAGQPPTSRIYNNNPDGSLSTTLNPGTNISFGNPLYYKDKFIKKNLEQRLTASVNLDWQILPELKFSARGSYFTINNVNQSFDKAYQSGGSMVTSRTASADLTRTVTNQYTAMLTYKKTFAENHHLTALLGAEYYNTDQFYLWAATKNSPSDLIPTLNAGSEASGVPSSTYTGNRIISQFGRLTYDYKMKYLFNFNIRRDGSSRLGNNKYGVFPGVSVGWNIHNENFYKNSSVSQIFSTIKPRLSYGVNGNVDVLSNYGVYGSYGDLGIYDGQTGYGNTALPTLDLRWERSTTLDAGLDLGIANNRVNLLLDYFVRDIKDKIAGLTLPYWTGFSSILTNNGTLRNKGFEAELNADIIRRKNGFNWNVGATFYTVKNFVVKLPDNGNENNRQGGIQVYDPKAGKVVWVGGLQEGKRVGLDAVYAAQQDYIYPDQASVDKDANRYDAYFQAGKEKERYPGDVRWVDVDHNDTIDYRDRVYMGRTTPSVTGGFTTNLNYKGFNLYVKTDYALGHIIYSEARVRGLAQVQGAQNSTTDVLNSWTPENRNTDIARYDFTDPHMNFGESYRARQNGKFWEKGDYLCLREVTLSYNFDPDFMKNYVKHIKVYFTGSNLGYLTKYSGANPEVGGIDNGRYPLPRVYTLGLNVKF